MTNEKKRVRIQGARSKFKTKKFKYFICHKEGYVKKDYLDIRQNKIKKTMILDGYESAEVLNVVEVDSGKEWILDSRGSFHML